MASRGKDKKDQKEDPEELMKRKFRAKCRFRALGRLVMANVYWLIEQLDQYVGDDVKRRVEQAVRSKTKKKQLLNVNDKALLNKPAIDRTDHEKKYIYRIVGGLKCFKRYPNHVKKKLAAVTYFKYYGPGRVIVRQGQEAHALYFIVTGKVTVSQLVFDELLHCNTSVDIGVMHAGDMFGEVSLLHNILRTATVTTNDHCEFLVLLKEDFKNVLQASVQKQWDEVRCAMSAFSYFDSLDEVARREGCIVAKLKAFDVNDILLGDGRGIANYVYFILSGRCQMIESLQIVVHKHLGQSYFGLYDPYISPEPSEQDLDKKYFQAYKNLPKSSQISASSILLHGVSAQSARMSQHKSRESLRKSRISLEEPRKSIEVDQEPSKSNHEPRKSKVEIVVEDSGGGGGGGGGGSVAPRHSTLHKEGSVSHIRQSVQIVSERHSEDSSRRSTVLSTTDGPPSSRRSLSKTILPPSEENRPSIRLSMIPEEVKPPNLQTFFMQVCQMNPGASFGFGENMRDRRIVALTPVYCMLMPKIWLLQRNTANIWTRIQHYLDKKIPTKAQLFKEFISQRRWESYRDMLVDDVVAHTHAVNYTSVHDVPYSIRMEEMFDI